MKLEQRIADLESRVEGLEMLLADALADSSTAAVDDGDEHAARAVERDQQRPSPAWGRD
jgi:hypothetical protein